MGTKTGELSAEAIVYQMTGRKGVWREELRAQGKPGKQLSLRGRSGRINMGNRVAGVGLEEEVVFVGRHSTTLVDGEGTTAECSGRQWSQPEQPSCTGQRDCWMLS